MGLCGSQKVYCTRKIHGKILLCRERVDTKTKKTQRNVELTLVSRPLVQADALLGKNFLVLSFAEGVCTV